MQSKLNSPIRSLWQEDKKELQQQLKRAARLQCIATAKLEYDACGILLHMQCMYVHTQTPGRIQKVDPLMGVPIEYP